MGRVITTSQLSNDDEPDPPAWFSGNERIVVFLQAYSGDPSAALLAVLGLNGSERLTRQGPTAYWADYPRSSWRAADLPDDSSAAEADPTTPTAKEAPTTTAFR